ncbi:pentapeptide repeat protein (plasmid) [Calothrix sp. NIES-4101]|nr:pentapeptide repeat protein [Calothrix sp. NIES-4101]
MDIEQIINQKIANSTANEWNNWKKQQTQDNPAQDLSFGLFRKFFNQNFQQFNFSQVNFSSSEIYNCDFSQADLVEANLYAAEIQGNSKFIKANLKQASLRVAKISQADFTEANLSETDCCGITINEVLLVKANLHSANLSDSKLTDIDLRQTDLTLSNLKGATFTRVDFSECIINPQDIKVDDRTKFDDIKCDFVYYLEDKNLKKYPPNGYFVLGEFEQFIQGKIDMNKPQKNRELLDGSGDSYRPELNSLVHDEEIQKLKKEVFFLENRLKSLELQEKFALYKQGTFRY